MNTIETEINDKLFDYIKGLNLINPQKLTLDTLLEKDLGITGDDAIDFIEDFAQEFDIDCSSFNYRLYFKEEGVDLFQMINRLFFREKMSTNRDISLWKLAEAIHRKKLI